MIFNSYNINSYQLQAKQELSLLLSASPREELSLRSFPMNYMLSALASFPAIRDALPSSCYPSVPGQQHATRYHPWHQGHSNGTTCEFPLVVSCLSKHSNLTVTFSLSPL